MEGKEVPTAPLTSYRKSREIAGLLAESIRKGEFLLTEKVESLPGADSGCAFHGIRLREKSG